MSPNMSLTVVFVGVMALTHLCETMSLHELDVGDKDTAASRISKPMVALKSIERKVAANGRNNFTVRFKKNIQNLKILFATFNFPPTDPDSLFEESGGVWVTSFVIQEPNNALVMTFADKDEFHIMDFGLTNWGSDPLFQNYVTHWYLETTPANDAVYNTDEDVKISILLRQYNSTDANASKNFKPILPYQKFFYAMKEDAGNWSFIGPQKIVDRGPYNLIINTSSHEVSGLLYLLVKRRIAGGSIAQIYRETKHIKVRPSTQNTTFPIGSVTAGTTNIYSPKENNLDCRLGETCKFSCYGYAASITRMELKQILPNGTHIAVPSAQLFPYQTSYWQYMYWLFEAQESSTDVNGMAKFMFSVYDDIHGTRDAKVIKVWLTPIIVPEQSYVRVEDDPNNATIKEVTFVCTARGRPLPTVVFFGTLFGAFRDLIHADKLISTSNDVVTAETVVTVNTEILVETINTIKAGMELAPYCAAYRDGKSVSFSDFYTYDVQI
ncbi:hypothetical protein PoB_003962400 [Plakobranchus ocellatus]|uniref:Uncharacterized protein n=1 Tax=Plakobranchus ocellatus TaxID=259542 RepID=A0AAV4B391_9GAST|nr:hypothetical protein PoB_003962400 [Plakobranchus ocellatus]